MRNQFAAFLLSRQHLRAGLKIFPLLGVFCLALVYSRWVAASGQPQNEPPPSEATAAVITSVKLKPTKLQVSGAGFTTTDKIEVDGKLFADTKAKGDPVKSLLSKEAASLGTGSYIVTIRAADQSRSAPFIFDNSVTNGIPKVTVTVTPPTIQVTKGQQIQLSAKALDAAGGELSGVTFTWATDNATLATVDATGKVTALGTGTVGVSASTLRNKGNAQVTIQDVQTSKPGVQITSVSPVVNEGQSLTLQAVVRDANGQVLPNAVITWKTDSPDIATVDATGKVQGVVRGFATIQASSTATTTNQTDSVALTVARVETNAETAGTAAGTGSVTVDNASRVYQTDFARQIVRRGPFGQPLELYAGLTNAPGRIDGTRTASRFNNPDGISVDNAQGNVYIADSTNHSIRCISDGGVKTVAGTETSGSADGPLAQAQFKGPRGILVTSTGDLFIADTGNHTIRFVDMKKGTVRTVAGSAGQPGKTDGTGSAARFNQPVGLAFDSAGKNIVVADSGNSLVRLVSSKGEVLTIGVLGAAAEPAAPPATRQTTPRNDEAGEDFPPAAPKAVSVDGFGNIYVAQQNGGVQVLLRSRGKYMPPINVAQAGTFAKADCVSVIATNIYVLDSGNPQQSLKRVTLAPPEIAKVDPANAQLSGGIEVQVNGRNFAPDTDVLLDGQPVSDLKIQSTSKLQFTAPAAISSGVRTLTVQHRGGIDQAPFFYDPPDLNQIPIGSMTSIAGGSQFAGDGGLALRAVLADPRSVSVDANGNVFFADTLFNRVRRVDFQSRIITTVAGTGRIGFSGDGKLATEAEFSSPESIAVDPVGNIYIADRYNGRIRRVDAATNLITTVAGGGNPTNGIGDGPALQARLEPRSVVLDGEGNLLIADQTNRRIRKLDFATGMISTIAGGGTPADNIGDGGSPLAAAFQETSAVTLDRKGRILVGDATARRIRVIDLTANRISSLSLSSNVEKDFIPYSLEVNPQNQIIIGTTGGRLIRVDTEAGTSDKIEIKGPQLGNIRDVTTDGFGNFFIADDGDYGVDKGPGRILRVDGTTMNATTYAGGGDSVGDGRNATGAFLQPNDCTANRLGELLISDGFNNRVRKVNLLNAISTVAGGGKSEKGSINDGGPATSGVLREPQGLACDALGNCYIADAANLRIRQVTPEGRIVTLAGTGEFGTNGDGGPALRAQFTTPIGLALDQRNQVLFVVDVSPLGSRIRAIDLRKGDINTIAGSTPRGFSGDNGPARQAQISRGTNVAVDGEGNIYYGDTDNHRVRRIDAKTGVITTVAGSGDIGIGKGGFSGDGGPAKSARLNAPTGLTLDNDGNLFIADAGNYRIRKVDPKTGIITTVAGIGFPGFDGDGKPALSAKIGVVFNLVTDLRGNLYLCDVLFGVVRVVKGAAAPLGINPGPGPK
ncbi:MAG: Ig-like domain-containing protein [Blastocatellia bacterium]|nr:Ig-like domain-containing protein [Blastocatellia bacterium]